ncbi:MAG: type II and III secretion system protein family protein, partial [Alphaproteobacteria bacterium]
FLAGGEFPIPVAQSDDSITIEFKQFGVAVDFNPTVLSPERISIQVRPEVSELTDEGAIEIGDIRVPALSVRRAETTVELGSGQSFAIAGLLQNNTQNVVSKLPGLGDLPILGRLFRSDRFQRDETELVIIVTPFIVQPSSEGPMASPLDGYRPATDLERIFFGKVAREGTTQGSSGPVGGQGVRLLGSAGFTY